MQMNLFQSIILGIIQGLTEFIPISSSGHLIIFQNLLGLQEPQIFFDIALHTGTLIAVVLFFRKEIFLLIKSAFKLISAVGSGKIKQSIKDQDVKLLLLIISSSIPTAILGFLFAKAAERIFGSPFITGGMLIITGAILWLTKYIKNNKSDISNFTTKNALIIGIVQGIAVIPGISRSGSTIAAAIFLGIEPKLSAKYSFLISIPAILGAQLISVKNFTAAGSSYIIILAGAFTAFAAGYISLIFLMKIVKKGKLYYFAPYCWLIGIFALKTFA